MDRRKQGAASAGKDRIAVIRGLSSNEEAIYRIRELYDIANVTIRLAKTELGLFDIPYLRTTYSPEWVAHQLTKGYIGGDAVVVAGFSTDVPFFWSDLTRTPAWDQIMRDAMRAGVGPEGYSIPVIDDVGRRSLVSLNTFMPVADWKDYVRSVEGELLTVARILHDRAIEEAGFTFVPKLGPRELECLTWVARGNEAGAIAERLSLSEHTVRSYLKAARQKLACRTLSQAVSKALSLRLIKV
ncbi:helix-turn-helix transcriptional regulator [Nitratireductor pacificus]|uniref:helix-turn-helix transcriptional regulator n=1 Tax=Nitratireductor pacificus TaxID=1231180 RepID=UPI0009DB166D|nr:LuxR family transcriptional regulator [Nitratireductor pacificus]